MSNTTVEEHRWLAAVEEGVFGVWDLDPRLELVHYSPEWKTRLGFSQIHAPDSTWSWRCRVHPDDLNPMLVSLRSHLDGTASSYAARFRLRINGSGYRTVLSRGRVVARDPQGGATQMVGTMVDLTDRPAAAAMHGLTAQDPSQLIRSPRLPFHALLAAAQPHAASSACPVEPCSDRRSAVAAQGRRLVGMVDDLLDMALREGSASQRLSRGR